MIKTQTQAGFTLIEMVIVVTIAGFLMTAATSLMASFARFKYATDVQQQLRSEANFAAGQIDLLIRNSNGIANLCVLKSKENDDTNHNLCGAMFCRGKQIPRSWRTDPTSSVIYDQRSASCCPGVGETYNYWADNADDGTRSKDRPFITLQELSQKKTCSLDGKRAQLEEIVDTVCYNETSQTANYNNTIKLAPVDEVFGQVCNPYDDDGKRVDECQMGDQKRLVVAREEYNPNNYICSGNPEVNKSYLDYLKCIGENKEDCGPCGISNVRNNFLTSNAVHVSNLEFSCQLKNHGMPNQAALITYTLTLEKPKRAMRLDFYNYDDLSGYETFTITRTVNMRNSGNLFYLPKED